MSDFSIAVGKTLTSEGGFSLNAATGECVNFGITVWFLRAIGVLDGSGRRATASEIECVRSLSREHAIALYRQYFWDAHRLSEVCDQALAGKIFDLTVNLGPGGLYNKKVILGAITLLQIAVNSLVIAGESPLCVDGILGARSLAAINRAPAARLLERYRERVALRYREIARNPLFAGNLPGWLDRLAA